VTGKFSEEDDVDQRVEPQSWVTEEADADPGPAADTLYPGDPQPVLAADLPGDAGGLPSSTSSSSSSSSTLPTTAPGVVPPGLPSSGLTPGSFGSGSPSYSSGSSSYDSGSSYSSGSSYGSGSDSGSGPGEGAATVSAPVPPPYPAQINSGKPGSPASPFSVLNKATKTPKPPKAPKAPKPPKPQKPTRQPRIKAETRPSLNGAGPAAPARRAHLAVIRLEPWSVMKFSFMISLVGWVVLFVMVAALWWVLSKIGVFHSIEGSVSNLTSGKDSAGVQASNWFSASRVLGYTMLVGAINVILITALATVGSVVYNLVTHVAGGIEVTLKETD